MFKDIRRVWRFQKGNQNPYIEEEQTTKWQNEKGQRYKQRSTKLTYKTKDRVTRTPLKTGGELRCSGRISSSCSTSDTLVLIKLIRKVWRHNWKIGSCQSRKDRQYKGQKKRDKRIKNGLQNTTQKTKGRATSTPLKHYTEN